MGQASAAPWPCRSDLLRAPHRRRLAMQAAFDFHGADGLEGQCQRLGQVVSPADNIHIRAQGGVSVAFPRSICPATAATMRAARRSSSKAVVRSVATRNSSNPEGAKSRVGIDVAALPADGSHCLRRAGTWNSLLGYPIPSTPRPVRKAFDGRSLRFPASTPESRDDRSCSHRPGSAERRIIGPRGRTGVGVICIQLESLIADSSSCL